MPDDLPHQLTIEEAISRARAIASSESRHASDNSELAVFLEEVLEMRKQRDALSRQCMWLLCEGLRRKCRALRKDLIDEANHALR